MKRPSPLTTMNTIYQNTNPTPHITRDLESGPDYEPDWRHTVAEYYLVEIGKAQDFSKKLAAIWVAEPDEYVLQLLLFHLNGPCTIGPSIDYAIRCLQSNPRTRIASQIKAMIVAEFHYEEIAMHIGTTASNVEVFANLFFDVERYRHRRTWLRSVCFPTLEGGATPESLSEAGLLKLAFNRGARGIREALFTSPYVDPVGKRWGRSPTLFRQMAAVAAERASEFYLALDKSGVPPTSFDLEVLITLSKLDTFFDSPCMRTAGAPEVPEVKTSEVRIKELLSLDWDTANTLIASIVMDFRALLDRELFEQLNALAEAEAKTTGDSPPAWPTANGGKRIIWATVLEELTIHYGVNGNGNRAQ
jgi:hypothetical protein